MSTVKPSELRSLVPTDEDNICEIFVKLMKFMLLMDRLHRYMWNPDGTITYQWSVDICTRLDYFKDDL